MAHFLKPVFGIFLALHFSSCINRGAPPALRPQYPSPMVDYTRPHYRIPIDSILDDGIVFDLGNGIQGSLYLPDKWKDEPRINLVIHFHGDRRVAQQAVDQQPAPWGLFHCQWGSGSSAYRQPIEELGATTFVEKVLKIVQDRLPELQVPKIWLSGWSAGYGAIRSIIRNEKAVESIDGVLLLDGMHCSYLPEGKVLAEGGALDSTQMQPFLGWARRALAGEKSFLITHSSVFPGTYASTTETAEYLLRALGISRQPLLREGPVGMQQTSVAARGKFEVRSFAGNSAPDHVDHYHGLASFLKELP